MPIIAASAVDQSGTSTASATRPTSDELMPSPTTATRMGSPAATTEPKTSSRIRAAAARPMPSDPISPCCAVCTTWPPTETSSPGRAASSASAMIRSVSATGIASGFSASSCTVARATVPSAETEPGTWYGLAVPRTCGTAPIRSSSPSTSVRTAGAVTGPAVDRTTTSTCSPDIAGKRSVSRS